MLCYQENVAVAKQKGACNAPQTTSILQWPKTFTYRNPNNPYGPSKTPCLAGNPCLAECTAQLMPLYSWIATVSLRHRFPAENKFSPSPSGFWMPHKALSKFSSCTVHHNHRISSPFFNFKTINNISSIFRKYLAPYSFWMYSEQRPVYCWESYFVKEDSMSILVKFSLSLWERKAASFPRTILLKAVLRPDLNTINKAGHL